MPIVHAIVLGITQGLSEFLPISSSGHLDLVPWLFGWDDLSREPHLDKAFDVALHLGTFVGAVAYFWRDLVRLTRSGLLLAARRARGREERTDGRVAWLLVVSAIPAAVVGATLESTIEEHADAEWLIATMLVVFGLVLLAADRMRGTRSTDGFALRDAALVGLAQALALQPGVSRSGITITAGRALGFDRDAATRLAFLMSIPVIFGAGLFEAVDVVDAGGIPPGFRAAFAWGTAASAVTGFAAVWGILRFVRSHTFAGFVAYRVVVGGAVLALLATSWR